jgi:sporulation protein YlmC with PRC-barrel domain
MAHRTGLMVHQTELLESPSRQKWAQTFEIGYSKIQKIKEIIALTLFCVIYY